MKYIKALEKLLCCDLVAEDVVQLAGDGSPRQFFRFAHGGEQLVAAFPAAEDAQELRESRSAWFIGRHLLDKGIALPNIKNWDRATGALIFEDLGDTRLQDLAQGSQGLQLYEKTVDQLAQMNVQGALGFESSWCWDSPRYDRQLMLARESGYFLRAFWQGLLGQEELPEFVYETKMLADKLEKADSGYFLHRDFQSRNVMVQDGQPRIIDFQGGRLGPLGYDLASLLIDPYVQLTAETQEHLLGRYYDAIAGVGGSRDEFTTQYYFLAVQRNLQIIGAFSFLSEVRGKMFFADFIEPALNSLNDLLTHSLFDDFPALRNTAAQSSTLYRNKDR